MRFENGWIKVHRKLLNREWSTCLDAIGKGVLLELLMAANIKDSRYVEGVKVKTLKRGQVLIGLRKLAKDLVIARGTLLRRLEILKNMGTITMETSHFGTMITICNYDKYQRNEKDDDPLDVPTPVPTSDHLVYQPLTTGCTPIEEVKEVKKTKKRKKDKNLMLTEGLAPTSAPIKLISPGSLVWDAYSNAYEKRYGHKPARNARESSICKQLCERIGNDDAVKVAEFYVSHSGQYYVSKLHPVTAMLADAQKLRTEWLAGHKMTTGEARNIELVEKNNEVIKRYYENKGMTFNESK